MSGPNLEAARKLVHKGMLKPHYKQVARGDPPRRFLLTPKGRAKLKEEIPRR